RARVAGLDSSGLVVAGRPGVEGYKEAVAQDPARVAGWGEDGPPPGLLETVRPGKVTVLLGLSGQGGACGREVVEAVAANTPTPLVVAMSNPTEHSEATPEDGYRWPAARATVATGSPLPPGEWGGARHQGGQANNAFVFPGLGLGALLARVERVTPGMRRAAAGALAEYTDPARIAQGAVYPSISA